MQKMHKISGDLAIISDERIIIFCLGIVVIYHEMSNVSVANHLRMHLPLPCGDEAIPCIRVCILASCVRTMSHVLYSRSVCV